MYISEYVMNTEVFKVLTDAVVFIMIASFAYNLKRVRLMMIDVMNAVEILKHKIRRAYESPYDKNRKHSRWSDVVASGMFILFGIHMILMSVCLFMLVMLTEDMEIIKRLIASAVCIVMFAVGFYYRVQAEKAWYKFRQYKNADAPTLSDT